MSYTSNGLYLGDYYGTSALEIAKQQIACKHPGQVNYLFPTDGSEPYACASCGAKFTWEEIERMNVERGGAPGCFKK